MKLKRPFIFFAAALLICASPARAEAPKRIISLTPATTEILFALGLEDRIVGVTTFCNYPEAALKKEKVGEFSRPNIEKILSLKPDVVFATGLEQASTVEKLKALHLNLFVSDPADFKALYDSIRAIAKLTEKESAAESLILSMQKRIAAVQSKSAAVEPEKRPRVFIEIWSDPLITAGKGSFVDELVTLAGGINIAQDTPRPYSYFSTEQVIRRNPDCIILGYMSRKELIGSADKRIGWNTIKAVKNGRVYGDINSDILMRPGPRLAEGVEEIHKRLYP